MNIIITRSTRPNKIWMVKVDKKTIHFGSKGASDFTHHNDETLKQAYIKRHQKRENWNDIFTAGFWSRWMLWNKPTMSESARSIDEHYDNVKLTLDYQVLPVDGSHIHLMIIYELLTLRSLRPH